MDPQIDQASILRALQATGIPGSVPPLAAADPAQAAPGPIEMGGEVPAQPETEMPSDFAGRAQHDPYGERQAEVEQDASLTNVQNAETDAGVAANQAKRDMTERRVQMAGAADRDVTRENEAYFQKREQTAKQADSETARWMADLDARSKEEPSPHRWWDNTSGFGKALYFLGLAFSAAAQARDPSGRTRNVVLDMMDKEIDRDVELQRQRLARELDSLRTKGDVMTRRQARDATLVNDVHAAKISHLNALSQALDLRAQEPGSADDAAALAEAKAHVEAKRVEIATQKRELIAREKESALNRDATWARQTRELNKDYDLAQIAASAKVDEARLKAKGERSEMPRASGIALVGPQGDVVRLELPKDDLGKKAAERLQTNTDEWNKGRTLSGQLGQAGSWESVTKSNPQLQSAIYDFIVPAELKEGGTRAVDMKAPTNRILAQYLGADPNGWSNAIRGLDPQDLKVVLDAKLEAIPQESEAFVNGVPGSNLPELEDKGYKVTFNPQDTHPAPHHQVSGSELAAEVTGEARAPYRPKTAKDLREAEKAGLDVGPLPEPLAKVLQTARAGVMSASDADAQKALDRARDAIDSWRDKASDLSPWGRGMPKNAAEAAGMSDDLAAVQQARATLETLQDRLHARPGEADIVEHYSAIGRKVDVDAVTKAQNRRGLNLEPSEIRRLTEEINSRIDSLNKERGFAR